MGIYVGDTEIKGIYLGDTPVKEVYLGDTKIRPSVTPITTSGIYRNETDGLISLSSDGSTRYTMADKNLGATSTDVSSSASYGNYYQRGNNYGFTSSPTNKANSQTNASTYGPGNYYSSNIFRYRGSASWYNWDSSNNANLRGGVTDTNDAKKGPCSTGFHIPSYSERTTFFNTYKAIGPSDWSWNGDYMKTYLKLPYAGYIFGNNASYQTSTAYWSSSSNGNSSYNAWSLGVSSGNISVGTKTKINGYPIRPFSDTAVQPDSSRTKLY